MPVDAEEIAAAANRNRQNEAPEFRAIQDSFDLARVAEMPQFPGEMPWYLSFVHATKQAIALIWNSESDMQRAATISRAILRMHPLAEDWVGRWPEALPSGWIAAVRRAMLGGLSLPVEIKERAKIDAYQSWFEAEVMGDLRTLAPETYDGMISYVRQFIEMPWEEDGDDAEN